jgi:hypothetical protein
MSPLLAGDGGIAVAHRLVKPFMDRKVSIK